MSAILSFVRRPFHARIISYIRPRAMSSKPSKPPSELRPSASVILLSPKNKVLLLHRVKGTSFASAHVFPGGNLDALHDGAAPPPTDPSHHEDGEVYRRAAVRECFEESGILLAKRDGELVELGEQEREEGRRAVHGGKVKFGEWVESQKGATPDLDGFIPFTRWITPPGSGKRFSTQMYLYPLPTSLHLSPSFDLPTPDGGVEHTSAEFRHASSWLDLHHERKITMYPPQYYLLTLLSKYFKGEDVEAERRAFMEFAAKVPTTEDPDAKGHFTSQIPWSEKVMSPKPIKGYEDGSVALALDRPSKEVEAFGGKRGGDVENVVVVDLRKGGPWCYAVRKRAEVLAEDDDSGKGKKGKL